MLTLLPLSRQLYLTQEWPAEDSLNFGKAALRRCRLDIDLASAQSDANLRISETAQLRWRDMINSKNDVRFLHSERSGFNQPNEGIYMDVASRTLALR